MCFVLFTWYTCFLFMCFLSLSRIFFTYMYFFFYHYCIFILVSPSRSFHFVYFCHPLPSIHSTSSLLPFHQPPFLVSMYCTPLSLTLLLSTMPCSPIHSCPFVPSTFPSIFPSTFPSTSSCSPPLPLSWRRGKWVVVGNDVAT